MGSIASELPAIIVGLVVVAFLALTGFRLGPRFLIRRIAGLIFVIIGVTFITFILGYLAPGSAIFTQLGQHYTPQAAAALKAEYGLNLPWYEQYGRFLNNLLHGSLGNSYINNQSVWGILQRYVPTTLQLGVSGTVLAIVVGIPLGLIAAVRANTRLDTSVQGISLIFYSLPSFVIIPFYDIFMLYLHDRNIPNLGVSGWGTPYTEIAPIIIYALTIFAYYVRITRVGMIEVLHQDYVRTARAKGLPERVVIVRHAFRNALIPLITAIGPAIAYAVVNVFIIEELFNIPGIGYESVAAVLQRDYPVVQGTVILLAFAVVMMNLVTDVAYGFADPRIKSQ